MNKTSSLQSAINQPSTQTPRWNDTIRLRWPKPKGWKKTEEMDSTCRMNTGLIAKLSWQWSVNPKPCGIDSLAWSPLSNISSSWLRKVPNPSTVHHTGLTQRPESPNAWNQEFALTTGNITFTNRIGSTHRIRFNKGGILTLLRQIPEVERSYKEELVPDTSHGRGCRIPRGSGNILYPRRQ